jgi:hypothetical protein
MLVVKSLPTWHLQSLPFSFILGGNLSAQGINFHQAYFGAFFNQQLFHSLVNVDNWAVGPHEHPSAHFDAGSIPTLHVFDFLHAIQTIGPGPSLIPATGLTHLQAGHISVVLFSTALLCTALLYLLSKSPSQNVLSVPPF